MASLSLYGMILITAALIFYSIGVWGEFLKKNLLLFHVGNFWAGLACDTAGTTLMVFMADGISFEVHSISGATALLLMLGHAIWATYVLRNGSEEERARFHKYSLFVWFFWLIPYFYPASNMV